VFREEEKAHRIADKPRFIKKNAPKVRNGRRPIDPSTMEPIAGSGVKPAPAVSSAAVR
jgi:hypothetical protein